MIEVEMRCALLPEVEQKLAAHLQRLQLVEIKPSQDRYYDTPNLDLLRHPQMVFVRLRENTQLQFKFDKNRAQNTHLSCIERSFFVSPDDQRLPEQAHRLLQGFLPGWKRAHTWNEAFRLNRLVEQVCIDKIRSIYTDGYLIVTIDQVKHLGTFVEVEANCEEEAEIQGAKKVVEAFLSSIGGRHIQAGYVEMWLYRYNQAAYQYVPEAFRVRAEDSGLFARY